MVRDIGSVRVLVHDGARIENERGGDDLMSAAWSEDTAMVAVPVALLGDDFFRLASKLAGTIIQKFANYHLRLAIVGDVSAWSAQSKAFHDFVYETNRGQTAWFVGSMEELEERLKR